QGGDALAAAKAQPDGIKVADKRSSRSERTGLRGERKPGEQDRSRSLEAVEDHGESREDLAARAQNVGRPDAAGTDLADVAFARQPRQDEPERHGPEQVAKRQGKEHLAGHGEGGTKPEWLCNLSQRVGRARERPWTLTPPSSSSIPASAGFPCWGRRASCFPTRRSSMRPTAPASLTARKARPSSRRAYRHCSAGWSNGSVHALQGSP